MNLLMGYSPPAIIYEEFWQYKFLIFLSIVIETFTLNVLLKYPLKKSFLISVIGNLISAIIGSYVMVWIMFFLQGIGDGLVPYQIYYKILWITSYLLMCLGSVYIEIISIKIIFKEKLKRLFIPMLIGNMIIYSFIAYSINTELERNSREKSTKKIKYHPMPNKFLLLDSTILLLNTSELEIGYDKNNKEIHSNHYLQVPYMQEKEGRFTFDLFHIGDVNSGSIKDDKMVVSVGYYTDTLTLVLQQKNPDPEKGWTSPIVTDTIKFIREIEK